MRSRRVAVWCLTPAWCCTMNAYAIKLFVATRARKASKMTWRWFGLAVRGLLVLLWRGQIRITRPHSVGALPKLLASRWRWVHHVDLRVAACLAEPYVRRKLVLRSFRVHVYPGTCVSTRCTDTNLKACTGIVTAITYCLPFQGHTVRLSATEPLLWSARLARKAGVLELSVAVKLVRG
jgi:hypothetical protein